MAAPLVAVLVLAPAWMGDPSPPGCPAVAAAPLEWTSEEAGGQRLQADLDVDGDGRADRLEAEGDQGSGFGQTSLSLRLTRSGERIEIGVESSFYSMVDLVDIPDTLREPGHACALALVEKALFGVVEDRPDPSLEWLLTPDERKTIRWIPGPPVLPASYTLRGASAWVFYRGGHHADRLDDGRSPPVELAARGGRVLLGTPHGVILTDAGRTRHAWIYVSRTGGDNKVRLPSIRGAAMEGNAAVIRLAEGANPGGPLVVRVDLTTGRLR